MRIHRDLLATIKLTAQHAVKVFRTLRRMKVRKGDLVVVFGDIAVFGPDDAEDVREFLRIQNAVQELNAASQAE